MNLKHALAAALVLFAGCAGGEAGQPTASGPEPTTEPAATAERYRPALAALDHADREVRGFVDRLPRCTTLAQALELALASVCAEEAYAGLEESALAALETVDVAGAAPACRVPLGDYLRRLRRFLEWAADTTAAGRNRQFFDFNTLAAQSRHQTSRYERAHARLARACG